MFDLNAKKEKKKKKKKNNDETTKPVNYYIWSASEYYYGTGRVLYFSGHFLRVLVLFCESDKTTLKDGSSFCYCAEVLLILG